MKIPQDLDKRVLTELRSRFPRRRTSVPMTMSLAVQVFTLATDGLPDYRIAQIVMMHPDVVTDLKNHLYESPRFQAYLDSTKHPERYERLPP